VASVAIALDLPPLRLITAANSSTRWQLANAAGQLSEDLALVFAELFAYRSNQQPPPHDLQQSPAIAVPSKGRRSSPRLISEQRSRPPMSATKALTGSRNRRAEAERPSSPGNRSLCGGGA
jgi:hypothetical protein